MGCFMGVDCYSVVKNVQLGDGTSNFGVGQGVDNAGAG